MVRLPSILLDFATRTPLRAMLNGLLVVYVAFAAGQGLLATLDDSMPDAVEGRSLAMLPSTLSDSLQPEGGRIPVAIPDDLRELRQTCKVLGIICRDDSDRSVFVRDLTSGDERIYRVGDILNEATLTEIHPSFIVLSRGSSRMVLNLFGPQDRPAPSPDQED